MIGGQPIAGAPVGSIRDETRIALTVVAESEIEALSAVSKTYLVVAVAESSSEALDGDALFYVTLGIGEAEANAFDGNLSASGTATTTAGIAEAIAEALDVDIDYNVDGVPELIVSRSGDTATINVSNVENSDIQLYRADSYRSNFSKLTIISGVPFDDTGLISTNNYKYKASFVVEGTKAGSPHRAESRRSNARYTKGS